MRSRADAARIQAAVIAMKSEFELMPEARDLPEGLSASAFKRRYRDTTSPAYAQVMGRIEQRISNLALHR